MSTLCTISYFESEQLFKVVGELTLESVTAVWSEAEPLFKKVAKIDIDLQGVNRSDSAALALLIEWMRSAKRTDKTIKFHNIPSQMMAIAKPSGLDEILPLN